MKRGDFVTIALQGDCGKPRPALVIQSDLFDAHSSVTVLLLSSKIIDTPEFRVTVMPNVDNGLKKPSQVMVDRAVTVRRDKLGPVFGTLCPSELLEVTRRLAVFLGIAK